MAKQNKNIFKVLLEIVSWLVVVFLICLCGLTLISRTNLLGGYGSFIIQSGSMEPSIMTGDVVITVSAKEYQTGDIITFVDSENKKTTHRIVALEEKEGATVLVTKGDANRVQDNGQITPDRVLGKVVLTLPRLGFLLAFGKSRKGIALLVIAPCTLLIAEELRKISRELKRKNKGDD